MLLIAAAGDAKGIARCIRIALGCAALPGLFLSTGLGVLPLVLSWNMGVGVRRTAFVISLALLSFMAYRFWRSAYPLLVQSRLVSVDHWIALLGTICWTAVAIFLMV